MIIKDIMTRKPQYIEPEVTLKEACELMRVGDYGFLPVGEHDRLIGIVTDRDIAMRAVAEGMDPNKTTVKDIMSPKVWYCFENDEVETAANTMEEHQLRRLIVLTEDKRMIGVVSFGDVATRCDDERICAELAEAVSEANG